MPGKVREEAEAEEQAGTRGRAHANGARTHSTYVSETGTGECVALAGYEEGSGCGTFSSCLISRTTHKWKIGLACMCAANDQQHGPSTTSV